MRGLGVVGSEVLLYLVVLGIVVVFHELGHFLAAKLVGVRVEVFSFGFGRRLAGRKIGETDYRISLFPLGGYVRMLGDGTPEERTGSPREFDSRSAWEKLLIMFMGPAFNLVLAFLLLAACFMAGFEVPAYLKQPVRVEFVEPGSPAEAAGIRPGDVIRAIDGRPVPDWETFRDLELTSPGVAMRVTLDRSGETSDVVLNVAERTKHAIGHAGIFPCHRVVVLSVNGGSPADRAGLRPDDVIAAMDDQPICTVDWLVSHLQAGHGAPVELRVLRGGRELAANLRATPKYDDALGKWVIGIGPAEDPGAMILERHPPLRALRESVIKNWQSTLLIVRFLGRLVTGHASFRSVSGPMELASIAKETAHLGMVPFIQLLSFISLNLAVFNLVPVPVLDGGRIALLLIEAVRGRELEQRFKELVLQAGLVMILVLMVVVIYFEIVKKLEG